MTTKQVTVTAPLALQKLIKANNERLREYQRQLLGEIYEASDQMMTILNLDPAAGWVLDIERMVYTRPPEPDGDVGEE
jgi:hypothetical protein